MSQDAPKSPAHRPSLREAFPGYFPPTDDLVGTFFTAGMVVLDTNTLLDTYKLTGTARVEFLDTLRALGDRLFIPHQVGLEFMRQRATVIKAGSAFPGKFREAAKKLHGEVQTLKEHRRLQDEDVSDIKEAIDVAIEDILKRHAHLYDYGVTLDKNIEHDSVFKEIEQITAGKVGPPFAKPEDKAKLGNQRFKEKMPPGYSDHTKDPDKALGDYYLWEQTIIEAERRHQPVLLVSNDGKEDWVRKEDSYMRGPRPELVDEMLARTGQPFHLVNVKSFLTYAKTYLRAKVSDSTIEQAESVQKQAQEMRPASVVEGITIGELIGGMTGDERISLRRALNLRTHNPNEPFGTRSIERIIVKPSKLRMVLEDGRWTTQPDVEWGEGEDADDTDRSD